MRNAEYGDVLHADLGFARAFYLLVKSLNERGCTCTADAAVEVEMGRDGGLEITVFHAEGCPLWRRRRRLAFEEGRGGPR